MEKLVIGEGCLTLSKITKSMKSAKGFSLLLQNWITFGNNLSVGSANILDLDRKVNLETLPLEEVPRELIQCWKAAEGSKATLKVLYDALVESGRSDVAESLVKFLQFSVNGRIISLETILGSNISPSVSKTIYDALQKSEHLFPNEPTLLIRKHVLPSKEPSYYVKRTLSLKVKLKSEIFGHQLTQNHVFLVKGTTKFGLSQLAPSKLVDFSGKQLCSLTVTLVILQRDEHFNMVCQITNMPVHFIEAKESSLFWIKSRGGVDTLRKFLEDDELLLGERELIDRMSETPPPCVFSISDSPGMGKTLLLRNLCKKMELANSNTIALYLELTELAGKLEPNFTCIMHKLAEYVTSNEYCKIVVEEALRKGTFQFDIFLDAYDEVNPKKLDAVDRFLKLSSDLITTRVHITTRPHLRRKLENLISAIPHGITPLKVKEQIEFLTKYWITMHKAKDNETLTTFAKKCLEKVHEITGKARVDVAGVPLQCLMVAKAYAEDAVRISDQEVPENIYIEISSTFDMYKKLYDVKLGRILKHSTIRHGNWIRNAKEYCINTHVYYSIALLFPDWITIFQKYLGGPFCIGESKCYSVGFMEEAGDPGHQRFIHRSFAEYIIAHFLVQNLCRFTGCFSLLFSEILGSDGMQYLSSLARPPRVKLNYSVIAYFVDCLLNECQLSTTTLSSSLTTKRISLSGENICAAVIGSCVENFENCFELVAEIMPNMVQNKHDFILTADKHLKYLPHLMIESTENHNLIFKLFSFFKTKLGWNIERYMYSPLKDELELRFAQLKSIDKYKYPWIPNCTPLHVASYHGRYNILAMLVKEYGSQLKTVKYLIHVCLRDSSTNDEETLKEKTLVLQMLSDLSKEYSTNWLEEEFEDTNCPPIHQNRVSLKLVNCLIQHGANVNSYSITNGTVLHLPKSKESWSRLVRLVFSKDFKAVNKINADGFTPLSYAISMFGTLDDESLQCFKLAGTDFNAVCSSDLPILAYAISAGCTDFIEKIIDLGADVNFVSEENGNAAHWVIECGSVGVRHWNSAKIIDIMKLLLRRGLVHSEKPNAIGQTPLIYAIAKLPWMDLDLLKYFHANGSNFSAKDIHGDSVLFYAARYSSNQEIIEYLMDKVDKSYRNKKKQNPLHSACLGGNFLAFFELLYYYDSRDLRDQDVDGNIPAHLLFKNEHTGSSLILNTPQILNNAFSVRNNQNNVPFVEWIENGKYSLPALLELKKELGICPNIASEAITALVTNPTVAEHYLENLSASDQITFKDFFIFLLCSGGKFTNAKFVETNICNQKCKSLNEIVVTVNERILKSSLPIPTLKKFHMTDEANSSPKKFHSDANVSLQLLVENILETNSFDVFMDFCKVWASKSQADADATIDTPDSSQTRASSSTVLSTEKENILEDVEVLSSAPIRKSKKLSEILDCTPFHVAAYEGDLPKIIEILDQNKDEVIHFKHLIHASVLNSADDCENVVNNKIKIVQLLVTHNPTWLQETLHGRTPLLQRKVHFKILKELVTLGADINACSTRGKTVLFQTDCTTPFVDLLRWALSNGFSLVNQCEALSGQTALMHAICKYGVLDDEVLALFQNAGTDFSTVNKSGLSVTYFALETGCKEFVRKAVELGVDVNHQDVSKNNAFHWLFLHATCDNWESTKIIEMMDLFLERKCKLINEPNLEGETPLHYAIDLKDPSTNLLHFFHLNGADFNATDNQGWSVLHRAIATNHSLECLNTLIECGADLLYINDDGDTAAHVLLDYACTADWDYVEVYEKMKFFTSKNFTLVNHKNNDGVTPIHFAMKLKNLELNMIDLFNKVGGDFNSEDNSGNSVLFHAVLSGQGKSIISKLVEYGANTHHLNCNNNNALLLAASFANTSAIEFLLNVFDDVNATDNDGDTPLHELFVDEDREYRGALRLLIKKSKFDLENKQGFIPIVKWITQAKHCLPTLVELADDIPFTKSIASKAITALVGQIDYFQLRNNSSCSQELTCYSELFTVFHKKGGRLIKKDGSIIDLPMLTKNSLERLKFLPEGENNTIENILENLLVKKQFDEFIILCQSINEVI